MGAWEGYREGAWEGSPVFFLFSFLACEKARPMSIASWMCSELGGDFEDWSDGEGNAVSAYDRFLFQIGCGGDTLLPPRPAPGPSGPASRRVLLVSLEGCFEIWDDPTLQAFRKALRARGHCLLEPLTWKDLCAPPGAAARLAGRRQWWCWRRGIRPARSGGTCCWT